MSKEDSSFDYRKDRQDQDKQNQSEGNNEEVRQIVQKNEIEQQNPSQERDNKQTQQSFPAEAVTEDKQTTEDHKENLTKIQSKEQKEIEMIEEEENPVFPDDNQEPSQSQEAIEHNQEQSIETKEKNTENPIIQTEAKQPNPTQVNDNHEEQLIEAIPQSVQQKNQTPSEKIYQPIQHETEPQKTELDAVEQTEEQRELIKKEEEDEFGDFEEETQKMLESSSNAQNTESHQHNPTQKPANNSEKLFSLKQDDPIIKLLNLTQETITFLHELPNYKQICDVAFA